MFRHFDAATEFSPLIISSKAFSSPRGFYSYQCYCLISLKSITIHFIEKKTSLIMNDCLSASVAGVFIYNISSYRISFIHGNI